jgi:rubrerythrin
LFSHAAIIPYSVETTKYNNLGSPPIVLTKIPDSNDNFRQNSILRVSKMVRDAYPSETYSTHWLKDTRLAKALEHRLIREQKAVQFYKKNAASPLPFEQET